MLENLHDFNSESVENRNKVRKNVVNMLYYILKSHKDKLVQIGQFVYEKSDPETRMFYFGMMNNYF